jgi:hypothetical protein
MGSAVIQKLGRAKTAGEAFDAMVEADQYDNGHNYDTGTIGCASCGFYMHPLDQKRFTKQALDRWMDDAIDHTSKHDAIRCIQIPKSSKFAAHSTQRGVQTFLFVGWVPE